MSSGLLLLWEYHVDKNILVEIGFLISLTFREWTLGCDSIITFIDVFPQWITKRINDNSIFGAIPSCIKLIKIHFTEEMNSPIIACKLQLENKCT